MARRASSGINSTVIIIAVIAAVAIAAVGWMLTREKDASSDLPELPISGYLNDANSMYGSRYSLEGEIFEKFSPAAGGDSVLSVKVDNSGQTAFIPVRIPAGNSFGNLTVRQSYLFDLEISSGGVATAEAVTAL